VIWSFLGSNGPTNTVPRIRNSISIVKLQVIESWMTNAEEQKLRRRDTVAVD
jgi:hypothetical protein